MRLLALDFAFTTRILPFDEDWDGAVSLNRQSPIAENQQWLNRTRRGQKQCSKCGAWVKGTQYQDFYRNPVSSSMAEKLAAPAPNPEPAKVVAEKPTRAGETITIAQVRAVAQTVTLIGGFDRCHELLGVIRDVGGLRRSERPFGSPGRSPSQPKQNVNTAATSDAPL